MMDINCNASFYNFLKSCCSCSMRSFKEKSKGITNFELVIIISFIEKEIVLAPHPPPKNSKESPIHLESWLLWLGLRKRANSSRHLTELEYS